MTTMSTDNGRIVMKKRSPETSIEKSAFTIKLSFPPIYFIQIKQNIVLLLKLISFDHNHGNVLYLNSIYCLPGVPPHYKNPNKKNTRSRFKNTLSAGVHNLKIINDL